jgi:hypothetical protein
MIALAIFNGDAFGLSPEINRGVHLTRVEGVPASLFERVLPRIIAGKGHRSKGQDRCFEAICIRIGSRDTPGCPAVATQWRNRAIRLPKEYIVG